MDSTKLPKKYDHTKSESKWRDAWDKHGIYRFQGTKPKEQTFVVDSPPPTVSGSLHIGHVFSYTHQDLIVRFQRMLGKDIYYPMGWDDNGLPTERRVQNLYNVRIDPSLDYDENRLNIVQHNKEKSKNITYISRPEFIKLCNATTKEDEVVFQDLWKTLGLSIDWKEEYATIDDHCRRLSQLSFLRLFKQGFIYQAEKPTMWDVDFHTAIAQAEVEDRMVQGAYHDIRFHIEGGGEFIISTTRPELLGACVAVIAHPDDTRYQEYFGKYAITPVFRAKVPIIADERAEIDKGTGILMVCTFGDATDVEWWKQYQLPLRQLIGRNGRMLESIDFAKDPFSSMDPSLANQSYQEVAGKTIKQAQKKMVELLQQSSLAADSKDDRAPLVHEPKPIEHPVKYYEKGERALEFIPTRQWFIRIMDKKEVLLEQARKIQWHPKHMIHRIEHWIEGLNSDWCISRQRYFGVAFPLWYPLDEHGNRIYDTPIFPEVNFDETAVNSLPIDPMTHIPPGYTSDQRNQPNGFVAEEDVMDTWTTSSMTPQIGSHDLLNVDRHAKLFPADIRPQSHEIIRTWAFYTMVKAYFHDATIPWHHVIISGWILDPDRKKMSKSKGNVVTPKHLLEKYSADGVRYWAACARLGADTAFDETVFKIGNRLATKIFNASKFALGILEDYEPLSWHPEQVTEELDRGLLFKLEQVITQSTQAFHQFEYAHALEYIESFFWSTFCDNYLELIKKRCYAKEIVQPRLSAQATLHKTLSILLRLFAPFLPYITEEVWSWYFSELQELPSIHVQTWPTQNEIKSIPDPLLQNGFDYICELLMVIRKVKSEQHKSIKWPVHKMKIAFLQLDKSLVEDLKPYLNDLQSAGNLEQPISWEDVDTQKCIQTEQGNFKVEIELASDTEGK